MKLLWHYTVNRHIVDILKSGYVDVARTNVYEPEKPVAWFSSAQFWELTVRKSVMVRDDDGPSPPWTLLEMYAYGIHACRIGVLPESAPLNWTALRIQANIQPKTVRHLLKVANEWGANPWEWFGSLTPVPREQWQATEIFNGEGWSPFTYDNKKQEMRIERLATDDPLALNPASKLLGDTSKT